MRRRKGERLEDACQVCIGSCFSLCAMLCYKVMYKNDRHGRNMCVEEEREVDEKYICSSPLDWSKVQGSNGPESPELEAEVRLNRGCD